jgi:hypothetical protein
MILNTLSPKNLIVTLVFEKTPIFFAENWLKLQKNCDYNIDPQGTAFSADNNVRKMGAVISVRNRPRLI